MLDKRADYRSLPASWGALDEHNKRRGFLCLPVDDRRTELSLLFLRCDGPGLLRFRRRLEYECTRVLALILVVLFILLFLFYFGAGALGTMLLGVVGSVHLHAPPPADTIFAQKLAASLFHLYVNILIFLIIHIYTRRY